jgi:ankyrin repeat protein/Mg2+ and Co2+ transporter CorA
MSSLASSSQFDHRHTELLKASSAGKEEAVFNLIDGEIWSTQTDRDALRQSLQRVSGRGNARLAEFLLRKGAEVNVRRESETSALYQAARAGHNKVAELLLRHGADPEFRDKDGRTALWAPVMRGFTETVKLLLNGHANVNARDKEEKTILIHLAAEKPGRWMQSQNMEVVHILLRGGADVEAMDKTKRTALSWAASTGKAELCDILLSGKSGKKADIRARNSKQQTALHWACENNHEATVKVLLEHGADPAARSDGRWTPLHMAAQRGHAKIAKLLLDQEDKTPVNSKLTNGMTALHWAAFKGHEKVVDLLLKRPDTSLGLKDTYDRTALLCAAENKHRDIMTKLSPGMTGERLPDLEKEASKRFHATVVDFGEFRDGKKQLVFKDHSVYELLHGWDHEKNKPTVATHVKNVRHQPAFRWIHLPANNISWLETLLAKAFIEGGGKDIEDYKALEKCFNQEHRGGEAHAHFMRTWSQRYAISPYRVEKPVDPAPHATAGVERSDAPLEQSTATLVATPQDRQASPPPTPRKPLPSPSREEAPSSGRKKQKKPKETMEDRHGKTQKRRNGPPGDAQSKKQKATDKAPSGAPKEAPQTPGANGKIVLFMPFLHYESDSKRKRMAEAIKRARPPFSDMDKLPDKHCADDLLIQAYLNHEPPLHVRRTLDQFFYHSIDTTERDTDQVVYRHFRRNLKSREPMIFMVDQLWLWILGKELIVTCFPQRWDQPANEDPLNVLLGIIEDMNAKTRPPIESVYDLAMLITGRCCGIFDRHRLENEMYQFLDMFEIAIGQITNRETRLFERFKIASAATSMYLMDVNSVRESRRYPEGRPSEGERAPTEYSKFLVDISIETQLLAEIKDIQDELAILNMVLQYQSNVLPEVADNIMRELGGKKSSAATEVERKMKEQLKLIQIHMKDIERMRKQTQGIYTSLTNLLDLKQKHANAFEARFASNQAALTARQGQTVLLFTIVTIIFLPMSFIAAFFAINVQEWAHIDGGRGLNLSYVSKYMFGIGLGISLPLIIVAFLFEDIAFFMRRKTRWLRRWRGSGGRGGSRVEGKEGRQMSDLEHKVQAMLDMPRPSLAAEKAREEKVRKSLDAAVEEKRLAWEDVGDKGGLRSRNRRESRASRGSNWSRPKLSLDWRRRQSEDLEVGKGNASVA